MVRSWISSEKLKLGSDKVLFEKITLSTVQRISCRGMGRQEWKQTSSRSRTEKIKA